MYVLENEIVHDSAKAYHILWMCISKFVTNTLFLRENFRKTLNAALLGRKKIFIINHCISSSIEKPFQCRHLQKRENYELWKLICSEDANFAKPKN